MIIQWYRILQEKITLNNPMPRAWIRAGREIDGLVIKLLVQILNRIRSVLLPHPGGGAIRALKAAGGCSRIRSSGRGPFVKPSVKVEDFQCRGGYFIKTELP
jgi:hypothetical protein